MNAATLDQHPAAPLTWPPDRQLGTASPAKIAMWIFLVSDGFSFFGLLLGWAILRSGSSTWRHPGEPALSIPFTAVLTFILICSSLTIVLAYDASLRGKQRATSGWLAATALLGTSFLVGQYAEYFGIFHPGLLKEGLVFGKSSYASTFYVITGFHGAHVFSGVIYILFVLGYSLRGKASTNLVEILGLFWHFVDLVWLLVFTLIYLLPVG